MIWVEDSVHETWQVEHFAQSNPRGPGAGDVPALMRRVADSIEQLGAVIVHDVVLHNEVTAEGSWYSFSVYFSRELDSD